MNGLRRVNNYAMKVQVRQGDTLWAYSGLFEVPLQLIVESNPTISPSALQIGDTVVIPGYIATEYTIEPGDTLWNIALAENSHVNAIRLLNPGIQSNNLQVGQTLVIPKRVTWRVVLEPKAYDYADLLDDLRRLEELYPFMRRRSIGSSVMGKQLPELLIGTGEEWVHADGSFHGNEWITTPVLIRFLNDYLLALTNNSELRGVEAMPLYQATTLSLVPMVNPDGVNLVVNGLPSEEPYRSEALEINGGSDDFSGWKANIRGVDLNNQFPALWEEEAARGPRSPAPRDYAGTAPLTEPESIAIADLTRSSDFARVLAFHTQGKVIFWGFEGLQPPESEEIVNEFARVSGYEPIEYADSSAGFKDWFIQDWRRPGFTVELGQGINPLPLSQFDEIYEAAASIMLAGLYM